MTDSDRDPAIDSDGDSAVGSKSGYLIDSNSDSATDSDGPCRRHIARLFSVPLPLACYVGSHAPVHTSLPYISL